MRLLNRIVLVCALTITAVAGCGFEPGLKFSTDPEKSNYLEPQTLKFSRDQKYLESLDWPTDESQNLSDSPWVHLLIIGQDGRGGPRRRTSTVHGDGTAAEGLASRADSINILSINRESDQMALYSLYRGTYAPSSCWTELEWQPQATHEMYLANLYAMGGRRYFVPCIEKMMKERLELMGHDSTDFEIHGVLEANFHSFTASFETAADLVKSLPGLLWTYRSHLSQFWDAVGNRHKILRELRARQNYAAGGYQRSFNHAKFIATALGYVAYGIGDGGRDDLLEVFAPVYEQHISHSFSIEQLNQALISKTSQKNLLSLAGFKNGTSPVPIIVFGSGAHHRGIYQHGKWSEHDGPESSLRSINTEIVIFPAPDDCRTCPEMQQPLNLD